jgi:NUMOD3 motif
MNRAERNIDWLMSLSRAQFNSATFAPGNTKWRTSLSDGQKTEFARKLSIANKGKVRSQETRHKISLSKLGKPLPRTPEWQAKITAALTGRKGRKHGDEVKRKISIANTGRLKGIRRGPQSSEHKQNYKNSLMRAGLTVRCITPLGVFNSRSDAARAHKVDPTSISNWIFSGRPGFSYLDQKDIDKCEEEKEKRLEAKALKVNRKKDRPVRTPIGDFPSIFSAAKKIGIDRSTLSDRIKRKWEGYCFLAVN